MGEERVREIIRIAFAREYDKISLEEIEKL